MNQKKQAKISRKQRDISQTLRETNKWPNPSDILGSYTGMDYNDESPEQDADDL